jgi:hypothetical protein
VGNIGDSMTPAAPPAVGATGTQYASDIDAILTEVIARLTKLVPLGSIAPGQPGEYLEFNGQFAQNASYYGLEALASLSGLAAGSIVRYNGNLYWSDVYGAVQITDGTVLSTAGSGSVDYGGSLTAAIDFVPGTSTYEFWDDRGGGTWAHLEALSLKATDQVTGRYTRVKASAAISATYDFVLPPAPPGSSVSALVVDSSGNVKLAENAPVGNGYKHTDRTDWLAANGQAWRTGGTGVATTTTVGQTSVAPGAAGSCWFEFGIPEGRRLKSITVRGNFSAGQVWTLYRNDDSSTTSIATATSGSGLASLVLTVGSPAASPANRVYVLEATANHGAAVYAVGVDYDYV